MKATLLSLIILSTTGFAAFSQNANPGKKYFQIISADYVTISRDSAVTTLKGNVDIKGNTFHFRKADKIVYNRKDNTLQIYNCAYIEIADSISVIKETEGKKYIRYQL